MIKDFSPAAKVIESTFNEYQDNQAIMILKRDLMMTVNTMFEKMNAIVDSNLSRNNKLNILSDIHYKTIDEFNDFNEERDGILTSFDKDLNTSNIVFNKLLSYFFSIIDTKYKRSIEIIG